MPELPEVELISRSLDALVRGRTIVCGELRRERLAPDITPARFAQMLRSKTIKRVGRRGKHILFDLTGDTTLITHLRMSGRFSIRTLESDLPKFTHALFELDDGTRLVFDDQRHFGLMKVVPTSLLDQTPELKKLAPEPFGDEFSIAYLRTALKGSKRAIKEFLLDQTKVCGLGNIYASEAMFAAGVHPTVRSHNVSKPKTERLFQSIRAVLEEAIALGSDLPIDPEDLEGNYFSRSDSLAWFVYDRETQPCRNCETPIRRLVQAGRSTYYCIKCQRR